MSIFTDVENRRVDSSIAEARPPIEAEIAKVSDLVALRQRWSLLTAVPVLATSRDEGVDNSWGGLDVRTLVRGEQSAGRFAYHSVVLEPGAELAAHYHEDAHSYVLVVDGEVEVGIGSTVEKAGKHALAYSPPLTRQSFRNSSGKPVTLAVVHSPAGSDRAFAAAREIQIREAADGDGETINTALAAHGIRFDDEVLPNDGLTNTDLEPLDFQFTGHGDLERLRAAFLARPPVPRLIISTPDEYDAETEGVTRRKELINGDVTGGTAMVNLLSGPPGMGAPPHHQPTEEEFFFITGGVLSMVCATESVDLQAGGFAFCPRNCTHGFLNKQDRSTQFVTLNSPAGHERAMAEVRRRMAEGATPAELHDLSVAGGFVFHDPEALA
ncbi:cupin domain-containing protein [Nocardioides sp. NPDC006303]|uniref:cupin domain-containing protein n=1 Tax=Nocardioides sp. NPDC006303 TaxID=3156747 RepID=UPI0033BF20F1